MPFTISHTVAVIPFKKKLHLDAMIIGSIMPDSAYFLPLNLGRGDTHTLLSIFTYSLPVGVISLLLFRYFLKEPLITLLPFKIKIEYKLRDLSLNNVLIGILSMLFGIFTHILWDSFTHDTGFMVSYLPLLGKFNIYKILQHGSSVTGLIIVIYTVFKRVNNWFINRKTIILILIPVILSAIMFLVSLSNRNTTLLLWLTQWIVFFGGKVFIASILIYSILHKLRIKTKIRS